MTSLTLDDILDIDAYERVRDAYRRKILDHKRDRRLSVGPCVSLVFEDRETLRYQIQEMTRVEGIRAPEKIQAEIDAYGELIPREGALSATLFIEIPELDRIQQELSRLIGIDEHVLLVLDDGRGGETTVRAQFDERQMDADRISAVHYVRFALTPTLIEAFAGDGRPRLRITHPNYAHELELRPEVRESLLHDLRGTTPVLLDPGSITARPPERSGTLFETGTVRARLLSPHGAPELVVVEAVPAGVETPTAGDAVAHGETHASWLHADPKTLAEMTEVVQRIARDLAERTGGCRVRSDGPAEGPLRFELAARSTGR